MAYGPVSFGGSTPAYSLPTASASTLGGVKVGKNLSIDGNGALSAPDPYSLTKDKIIAALDFTPANAASAAQMPYSITYEGMYTGTGVSTETTPLAISLSKVYDAVGFIRVAAYFQKTTATLQNMLLYALAGQYNSNYNQAFHSSFVPMRALSEAYDNKQASVGFMIFEDTDNDVLVKPRRQGSTLYITAVSGFSTKLNASGYRYFYFGLDLNSSIKGVVK